MRSTAIVLIAIALGVAGCGPSNLHECKMEAAKMPTGPGVAVASRACNDKFDPPKPVEQPTLVPFTGQLDPPVKDQFGGTLVVPQPAPAASQIAP